MYQNIVDDDIYNKDIFIILDQCFNLIVGTARSYTDVKIKQDNSICALIVKEFLKKTEIQNYAKQVVRNMVLEISKIDHEVAFARDETDKNDKK